MWLKPSGSNGGSSAGEMGCVALCHPGREMFLDRHFEAHSLTELI